jgi:hypothetical protein
MCDCDEACPVEGVMMSVQGLVLGSNYTASIQIERDSDGPPHVFHFDKRIICLDNASNDDGKLNLAFSIPSLPEGANLTALKAYAVSEDSWYLFKRLPPPPRNAARETGVEECQAPDSRL